MLAVSGHYAYAELSGVSERVLVTLPRAGYACGLTFSYLLTGGGGVSAMLRTASGRVLPHQQCGRRLDCRIPAT